MTDIYEETAEMFLTTMAGQFCGMSKEQLIQHFKSRFPSEEAFRSMFAQVRQQAESTFSAAQSSLKPGQSLAFGYAVGDDMQNTRH